jgi:hypothetical protein
MWSTQVSIEYMPATFTVLYCTEEIYKQYYARNGLHIRDKGITAAPDVHVLVEA